MESFEQFIRYHHILAVCEDAIYKNSFELNLSRYDMDVLPPKVRKCTVLKMFLNNNKLTQLPSFIGELAQLSALTIDYNLFSEFPRVICDLLNLTELNISCNRITQLPPEIGQLVNLEIFWCNNTGLRELPHEIGNCDKIETFGARGNALTSLPTSIGLMQSLRWLTLESNNITEVPKSLSALKNLVHLNLKSNKLTRVPENLCDMRKLRFVFLNDNRITMLPSLEELKGANFIYMLNLRDNPVCDDAICNLIYEECPYIIYKGDQTRNSTINQNNDDEEFSSDWEHSINTSELNTTDEDSMDSSIEDVSLLIPTLSRFATNSG